MNKTFLLGRLTTDIELRTNDKGTSVVKATVAINNGKDDNGNDRETDFIRFYVFNKTAENLSKFCKKGSQIFVEGRIKNRSWDKEDGSKGYETAVYASRIIFLDTKKSEGVPLPDEPQFNSNQEAFNNAMNEDPFMDFGSQIELDEDSLPF